MELLDGGLAATQDPHRLSSLIASVYDASLDPSIWPVVLRRCRDYLGGRSACIYAKTLDGTGGQIFFDDGGIDPAYKQLYFERYATLDPTNAGHIFAELEQPVSTLDLFLGEEFCDTRFYREWAEPQGLVDFICAPIEKAGGWAALFGVFRSRQDGMVDDAMRERMRLLVPHIRRAVLIGRAIEERDTRAADLGDAFDGLAAGMFLVDASGRIVHANRSGAEMLAAGQGVVARSGRLSALDRHAAAALAEIFAAAPGGDEAVGTRGISMPIETGEETRFVAHVLPLRSGARRLPGADADAVAAVFVNRAALHTPAAPELVAKSFGLTLAELRVLVTIVQAGGIAETAEALGIAETTVKTHLQRLFSKTGTSRQTDLVKLFVSFSSPLAA